MNNVASIEIYEIVDNNNYHYIIIDTLCRQELTNCLSLKNNTLLLLWVFSVCLLALIGRCWTIATGHDDCLTICSTQNGLLLYNLQCFTTFYLYFASFFLTELRSLHDYSVKTLNRKAYTESIQTQKRITINEIYFLSFNTLIWQSK